MTTMVKRVYVTRDMSYTIGNTYKCPFRDEHVACEQCTVQTECECLDDFPDTCPLESVE